jgi:hypothetical protein
MDFYAEQILAISFDESGDIMIEQEGDKSRTVGNHVKVQRDRLKVDSLKWTASRLFPKRYGDKMELLAGAEEEPKALTITWLSTPAEPPVPPPPPRQIPYRKPERPADLSERDWSLLMGILERVKARTPADTERPPSEVLEAVGKAIDALYA